MWVKSLKMCSMSREMVSSRQRLCSLTMSQTPWVEWMSPFVRVECYQESALHLEVCVIIIEPFCRQSISMVIIPPVTKLVVGVGVYWNKVVAVLWPSLREFLLVSQQVVFSLHDDNLLWALRFYASFDDRDPFWRSQKSGKMSWGLIYRPIYIYIFQLLLWADWALALLFN